MQTPEEHATTNEDRSAETGAPTWKRLVSKRALKLAYGLLMCGILLLCSGTVIIVVLGGSLIGEAIVLLLCLTGIAGGILLAIRMLGAWNRRSLRRSATRSISPLAADLTPQLFGEYSPYVIEAAEKLGAARDTSAVPALLIALEDCVNVQRPGWREVAEPLTQTLARIGDRRALPLLYRLENVRGIGIIPTIRTAIASIEPQTSLLRPSTENLTAPEMLLRPAGEGLSAEPNVLLRPTQADSPGVETPPVV